MAPEEKRNSMIRRFGARALLVQSFIIMVFQVCFLNTYAYGQFGSQLFKLKAADGSSPSDLFGWRSIGISDAAAIVGASQDYAACATGPSCRWSGSAYLFDITTGKQIWKLTASDAAVEDYFGSAVALSDNTALIGAMGNNDSGAAYVFDVTTGTELRKLTASAAAAGDVFGFSVAISDDIAIIGSHGDDGASGSAYLFDVATGQQLRKLTASDIQPEDVFGFSVAISGNTAIVGARNNDERGTNAGAAYLYDVITGQELFKLTASDAVAGDEFGFRVAINGNRAIVGAVSVDGSFGAAYLFDVTTGQELRKLTASDRASGDWFGTSVAINDSVALVGAHNEDDGAINSGSVYVFDIAKGEEIAKLQASDRIPEGSFGASLAAFGTKAIVGANGNSAAYVFNIARGTTVPGDFNNDGTVDAADYIVWRNGLGTSYTQADYDAWRANFGRSADAIATAGMAPGPVSADIPEPASALIAALFIAFPASARHQRHRPATIPAIHQRNCAKRA
jgi:outer membrane protein assembly factor BamB